MSVFHVRQRRAAAIKLTDSRQKDHTEGVPPLTAAKREVAYASVVNATAFNTLSSYIGFGVHLPTNRVHQQGAILSVQQLITTMLESLDWSSHGQSALPTEADSPSYPDNRGSDVPVPLGPIGPPCQQLCGPGQHIRPAQPERRLASPPEEFATANWPA